MSQLSKPNSTNDVEYLHVLTWNCRSVDLGLFLYVSPALQVAGMFS